MGIRAAGLRGGARTPTVAWTTRRRVDNSRVNPRLTSRRARSDHPASSRSAGKPEDDKREEGGGRQRNRGRRLGRRFDGPGAGRTSPGADVQPDHDNAQRTAVGLSTIQALLGPRVKPEDDKLEESGARQSIGVVASVKVSMRLVPAERRQGADMQPDHDDARRTAVDLIRLSSFFWALGSGPRTTKQEEARG